MPSDLTEAFHGSALGLRRGVVRLAPPNTTWPLAFARAGAVLRADAPACVGGIEHIGSTSVPGLAAKPILDLAVGLTAPADLDAVDAWLTGHGLLFRGDRDAVRPDLMYGLEFEPMIRVCNVHVIMLGGREWSRYLGFRDRLRADDVDRDAYGALKARLAAAHTDDRIAYIDGKSAFIVERRD